MDRQLFCPAGSGCGYGSRKAKITHNRVIEESGEISCFEVLDVLL
jgi:hypothetical protein